MNTETIVFRATFSSAKIDTYEEALDIARDVFRRITTGKDDEDTLSMTNARFEGVSFTLSDIRG